VHVHALDAEALKAAVDLAEDALTREPAVGRVAFDRVEDLGRQHRLVAGRGPPAADPRFAAPASVGVGGVEARDAPLPRGIHQPERLVLALPPPEELRRGADPAEVAAAEDEARKGDGRITPCPANSSNASSTSRRAG